MAPQSQPTVFTLNLNALLSLPYRLCNPPPAVGKVRSCGVTPVFKVQLDDVLNRKHLPPLGLKDFEEWLLFVEQCPENLYFVLWLREYTAQYNQWALKSKARPKQKRGYRVTWPAPTATSPRLALSFARAKQTFFAPASPYELALPPALLAPFHSANPGAPHPDPAVFADVARAVRARLTDSLRRFVSAAVHNVGTARALCGIVAGTVFALAGALPPLAVNFASGRERWLRLLAVPGLWLGLTVLIASLHGVCMMIYIFGDVRQLRTFELARPRISPPQPLPPAGPSWPRDWPRPALPPPLPPPPPPPPPISPLTGPPRLTIALPAPPPPARTVRRGSALSLATTTSVPDDASLSVPACGSSEESLGSADSGSGAESYHGGHGIYISRAYRPEDDVRTCTDADADVDADADSDAQSCARGGSGGPYGYAAKGGSPAPTASFIPPFPYTRSASAYSQSVCSSGAPAPARGAGFDFDGLPPPIVRSAAVPDEAEPPSPREDVRAPGTTLLARLRAALRHREERCACERVRDVEKQVPEKEGNWDGLSPTSTLPPTLPYASPAPEPAPAPARGRWRARLRAAQRVPAFGPVTRVLSPVVSRAQWEIVVRSAALAGLLAWTLAGALLALPMGAMRAR